MDNYDRITELFKDETIKNDLLSFSTQLYNSEIKDHRVINELIAFYGNMILEETRPGLQLKTTRYNEKIWLQEKTETYYSHDLRFNDFSYSLIVDTDLYSDWDNIEEFNISFNSHLRSYILKLLEDVD